MKDIKDSFILFIEHKEIFNMLTDKQAGKLIKVIFEYEETGNIQEMESLIKMAFVQIKNSLDRNRKKWQDEKEKRSQAGKKGMEKRWKNNKDKQAITKNNSVITNDNNVINDITKNNNVIDVITRHNKNN